MTKVTLLYIIIIIEFTLIIAASIYAILLYKIYKNKSEREGEIKTTLRDKFFYFVEEEEGFSTSKLSKAQCDPEILIATITDLEAEGLIQKKEKWLAVKNAIGEDILLPIARYRFASSDKNERLLASRIFALFPHKEDEEKLLQLIDDQLPIIKYSATHSLVQIGSKEALYKIIQMMSETERMLRHPYHDALHKGGERVFSLLEELLEKSTDSHTRVSIIELLRKHMNEKRGELIKDDLNAEHKNLRIAAIRAYGHLNTIESSDKLLSLLDDTDWEVRALAARSLGYLKAEKAITKLDALLKDKVWWVRLNSALALKKMGAKGIQVLNEQKMEQDKFAYEIANYVLPLEME